ncbi:MAG: hypothetical protein Q9166_006190 [cf. Caloplaca sp. 2 TL-2023]
MDCLTTPPDTPPSAAPHVEVSPPKAHAHPSLDNTPQTELPHSSSPPSPASKHRSAAAVAAEFEKVKAEGERWRKHPIPKTFDKSISNYLSQSNEHIDHLNRLLLSTPSLDLILATTSYTLSLLTTLLSPSPSKPNSRLARSRGLRDGLAKLADILSETRVTLRLVGLVGIYIWAKSEYETYAAENDRCEPQPPSDPVIRSITITQIVAGFWFQILENLAFLGDKGIIPLKPQTRSKYWIWCCRAWAAHVFLELARLGRERYLDNPRPKVIEAKQKLSGEGDNKLEEFDGVRYPGRLAAYEEEEDTWWRKLKTNAAYAPMTVHYSFESGLLSSSTVALCGVMASWLGLKGAWRRTVK